jgi:DNA-binding CsgD family transcriptional regulator
VVVIGPAKPEEVAWLNVAAYGPSPREAAVVKLVARVLSTRQIAASLFVSEYTVQRHLRNAFEKVGVKSRRELMKRLFFESLLPGMLGDQGDTPDTGPPRRMIANSPRPRDGASKGRIVAYFRELL